MFGAQRTGLKVQSKEGGCPSFLVTGYVPAFISAAGWTTWSCKISISDLGSASWDLPAHDAQCDGPKEIVDDPDCTFHSQSVRSS